MQHSPTGPEARSTSLAHTKGPSKRTGVHRFTSAFTEQRWEMGHMATRLIRAWDRPALPDYLPEAHC